jgi:hypothetical protein
MIENHLVPDSSTLPCHCSSSHVVIRQDCRRWMNVPVGILLALRMASSVIGYTLRGPRHVELVDCDCPKSTGTTTYLSQWTQYKS